MNGVSHFRRADQVDVWTLDVSYATARLQKIIVLTDSSLFVAQFAPHHDMESAVAQLSEQGDPVEVIGRKATTVRLSEIRRAERIDFRQLLSIQYVDGERLRKLELHTPTCELFVAVFTAIQVRLGDTCNATTEKSSAQQALSVDPFLALCMFPVIFLAMAGILNERPSSAPKTGQGAGLEIIIEVVGSWIGPIGGWIVAVGLVASITGMIIYRLKNRPEICVLSIAVAKYDRA